MTRTGAVARETTETKIEVSLDLDGGEVDVSTGVPFFDHMLDQVGRHARFGLRVVAQGDLAVDAHHTVEDTGICIGEALAQALGDKRGIARYGAALVPMDEALCRAVVDLSGRFYLVYEVETRRQQIGNFSVELAEHFWRSLTEAAGCNLHLDCLRGRNTHHILEGTFKAAARKVESSSLTTASQPTPANAFSTERRLPTP